MSQRHSNHYGNAPTTVDGIRFASKAEARRYGELKLAQLAGQIRDLELQPRFMLVEGCILDGRRKPALRYTADFAYHLPDGRLVVEDVKGGNATRTEAYVMRRHLMKALLSIEVVEVQ
jgi:hypothetical protein